MVSPATRGRTDAASPTPERAQVEPEGGDGGWGLAASLGGTSGLGVMSTYDGWVTDPPGRRFCGVWRGGLKPGAGGRAFVTWRRRGRELRGRDGGAVIAG